MGVPLLNVIVLATVFALQAFTAMNLFNWFIVDVFNINTISFGASMGLLLATKFFTSSQATLSDTVTWMNIVNENIIEQIDWTNKAIKAILTLFTLFVGWLIQFIV